MLSGKQEDYGFIIFLITQQRNQITCFFLIFQTLARTRLLDNLHNRSTRHATSSRCLLAVATQLPARFSVIRRRSLNGSFGTQNCLPQQSHSSEKINFYRLFFKLSTYFFQTHSVIIQCAYGSSKDITVYTSIGLKPKQIFIVGKASKKQHSMATILTDGYAAHLAGLLTRGATRPAQGNARMVIPRGYFGLPGQASRRRR